jgi:hypothetical protein
MTEHNGTLQHSIDAAMKNSVGEVLKRFEQNLKVIQDRAVSSTEESEQNLKAKITEILINFEQNMTSFLTTSQQRSMEAITLEVKSARQLIDTYKQEQMRLVDENIIAVLEQTMALVMQKQLTLKEHVDLVFESLEKAKSEKFFV